MSVKRPIKNLLWFIAGAIILNAILYFTAGWSPKSESFVVLSASVQTIVALAAITALVFPGYFDSLKQKQNLSSKVVRELGRQRLELISNLTAELRYFELVKLLLDSETKDWLRHEKDFKLKLQEPSPLVPSSEDSKELLSEAAKFGLNYEKHNDTVLIFEKYDTEQHKIARSYLESDAGNIDSKNLNAFTGVAEIGILKYELKVAVNKKIESLQRILTDLNED